MPGRAGAAPTKPGRVSTAKWGGSGERGGTEHARNGRYYVLILTPARTWRMRAGSGASCRVVERRELPGVCLSRTGRPQGRSAAYLWRGRRDTAGLLLRRANDSERLDSPLRERKVRGRRIQRPVASAALTTVVDAWGRSWTPRRPDSSCGLLRRTAVDSCGPEQSPDSDGLRGQRQEEEPMPASPILAATRMCG